jgi:SAM-dependent methyltransferase
MGDNNQMSEPAVPQREPQTNQAERLRWNDPAWVRRWLGRQALTDGVSGYLLDALAPADGERILEIGSGAGRATLVLAAAVPRGAVTGADISAPLSALARQRAADQGAGNVSFAVADMQQDTVPGGPFDAAASQFGVMFFDEPVTAFANIRRHVRPGGRLAFICWQQASRNPWMLGEILAPFLPPPAEPAPGKRRPGPFSLADREQTRGLLEAAGWEEVAGRDHDVTVRVPLETLFEDDALSLYGVAAADQDRARQAVDARLAPLARGDGEYEAPLAFRAVTARASRG